MALSANTQNLIYYQLGNTDNANTFINACNSLSTTLTDGVVRALMQNLPFYVVTTITTACAGASKLTIHTARAEDAYLLKAIAMWLHSFDAANDIVSNLCTVTL